LPSPDAIHTDLKRLIEARTSTRKYQPTSITQEELAYLLWCTQGVKEITGDNYATHRNVPSAGARHAFETFVLANRVDGLPVGVYRYLALEHKLEEYIISERIVGELTSACANQEMVREGAVTFFWAADIARMTWRYDQRGYRYIFLDAGHVCQNLYLTAETIGCGVCAIAAYEDDKLNTALDLDGENMFVAYLAALGKKLGSE
ncbi:MAG: SagB/ThcOx family dehydrogenase, partial [Anaerolineales bacterium]|nr:SagB/ThcOx family dehydrogenase [Anaerolineales bacterium]